MTWVTHHTKIPNTLDPIGYLKRLHKIVNTLDVIGHLKRSHKIVNTLDAIGTRSRAALYVIRLLNAIIQHFM